MEIMPYTGPGSAIVPKPTTIPPPRVPFGPQPLIGPQDLRVCLVVEVVLVFLLDHNL